MLRLKRFTESENFYFDQTDHETIQSFLKFDYEDFILRLKDYVQDPKTLALINNGRKDGLPNDEKIQIDEEALFVCEELLPTQSQIGLLDSVGWLVENEPYRAAKLIKGDTSDFENHRILTANGKWVIDGHHRWSQIYVFNPKAKVPCVNLNLPDLSQEDILKIVQLAIASTYKKVELIDADAATDIFDDAKMSEQKLISFIPKLLGRKVTSICQDAFGFHSKEEVYDKIIENIMSLKEKKPSNAPKRVLMPQPLETASKSGVSKSKLRDFRGMPSDFINKLKNGRLNFKEPFFKNVNVKENINLFHEFINESFEQTNFYDFELADKIDQLQIVPFHKRDIDLIMKSIEKYGGDFFEFEFQSYRGNKNPFEIPHIFDLLKKLYGGTSHVLQNRNQENYIEAGRLTSVPTEWRSQWPGSPHKFNYESPIWIFTVIANIKSELNKNTNSDWPRWNQNKTFAGANGLFQVRMNIVKADDEWFYLQEEKIESNEITFGPIKDFKFANHIDVKKFTAQLCYSIKCDQLEGLKDAIRTTLWIVMHRKGMEK